MRITPLIPFLTIIALVIYLSTFSSCTKEYSCEGCFIRDSITTGDTIPETDTTIIRDTAKIDSTINFPFCPTCESNPTYVLNRWSCRNYKSLICGNVYYVGFDTGYNRNNGINVTIRGFQNCVRDTQFVITGRFPTQTFEADRANLTASHSEFLFYTSNNVILAVGGSTPLTMTPSTMNVVLETFNYLTGTASFRFFGYAYTNKGGSSYVTGDSSYISDGRIEVKIK